MWGYWLFIVIEAFVMHLLLPADALAMADVVYIGFICINTLILLLVIGLRYGHDRMFMLLLTGGFLFRLFLLFWSEYFSHIFMLPNSGTDEMTYYYNAMSNLVKNTLFNNNVLHLCVCGNHNVLLRILCVFLESVINSFSKRSSAS